MKAMQRMAAGVVLIVLALGAGCRTATTGEQYTGAGAAAGAILGAVMGHNLGSGSGDRDKGAAIGAVVGGLIGNQLGVQRERQDATTMQMQQMQQQMNTTVMWIQNSNGSRTPVSLQATAGGMWIGPRGEYYQGLPTEQQLKSVYGF